MVGLQALHERANKPKAKWNTALETRAFPEAAPFLPRPITALSTTTVVQGRQASHGRPFRT